MSFVGFICLVSGLCLGVAGMVLMGYANEGRKKLAGPKPEGSNALLAQHGIPRPELLLVNMLALKIAGMAEIPKLSLGSSQDIEIPLGKATASLWYMETGENGHVGLSVTRNGSVTNCVLTREEQEVLLNPLAALMNRSKQLKRERNAQLSSDVSLDLLTEMLSPIEDK